MGFLHALYGFTQAAFNERLQAVLTPAAPPGASEDVKQIQEDFTQGIRAVQNRYLALSLVLDCARLAISVCLVLGGIWCLGGKPEGRKLLVATFAATLGFEVCDSLVQTLMARELVEPVTAFGRAIDQSRPPQSNAPSTLGVTMMVGLLWFGMCIYYLLQAAKGAYYLAGFLYLRRPSLDPLFVPQAEAVAEPTAS